MIHNFHLNTLYTVLLLAFSPIILADIQCDDKGLDNYEQTWCDAAGDKDFIDNTMLKAYAYLIDSTPTCDADDIFYLYRDAIDNYIDYSISLCLAKVYCNDNKSLGECGLGQGRAEARCGLGWASELSGKIKSGNIFSSENCDIPTIKDLPELSNKNITPSFSCKKASSTVEKFICKTPSLMLYDRYLAYIYRRALKAGINELKASQKIWLVSKRCDKEDEKYLPYCLDNSYKTRIFEIESAIKSKGNSAPKEFY